MKVMARMTGGRSRGWRIGLMLGLGWLLAGSLPVVAESLPSPAPAYPATVATTRDIPLPPELEASAVILRGGEGAWWEKTLVVRLPQPRTLLSTSDGWLQGRLAMNHGAHPVLWGRLGAGGKGYTASVQASLASREELPLPATAMMATAADVDLLAVVTQRQGPLTVTALVTAGARSNAQRTGVDGSSYIEGLETADKTPAGTINVLLLTNIELSEAALARALITVTEAKSAALQDLQVPSSYTPGALATGTGTDSIIVVSGRAAPRATYTGGHSRIGELIGKAVHQGVIEALGRQNGYFLPGSQRFPELRGGPAKADGSLRLALLHLAPEPGEVAANRARIEAAIREAAQQGADWIITPELAETGYGFARRIGTDWIAPFPDAWVHKLAAIARDNGVALFVGLAEREPGSAKLFNSLAVINREGRILGTYRKQRPVGGPGGAEGWSSPGSGGPGFMVDGVQVGPLICADTWPPEPAAAQRQRGAELLLVPANWAPLEGMGPGDVWERRAAETGLPVVVVNRGGAEPELDFSHSESAISLPGHRHLTFTAPQGGIFYVDWQRKAEGGKGVGVFREVGR